MIMDTKAFGVVMLRVPGRPAAVACNGIGASFGSLSQFSKQKVLDYQAGVFRVGMPFAVCVVSTLTPHPVWV